MLAVLTPRVRWAIALAVLGACLVGLWRVMPQNGEVRLTGDMLLNLVKAHPPKPWRGFSTQVLEVSVARQVRITARVSGYGLHTPVEIVGAPEYDASRHAMFFHVSQVRLPDEASRPVLRRFNKMLNPLATYIARYVMDAIPARKFKSDTRGGLIVMATVKAVRVEGDAVVVSLHGFRVAWAAAGLMICALLAVVWLAIGLRRRPRTVKT